MPAPSQEQFLSLSPVLLLTTDRYLLASMRLDLSLGIFFLSFLSLSFFFSLRFSTAFVFLERAF